MTRPLGKSLIIRADASTQIGTGHVMRCLALAQAWQEDGGRPVFVMGMDAPTLEARLKSEGVDVVHRSVRPGSVDDAAQTADLAQKMGAPWVVADGYHFGADYQRMIKNAGLYLLSIDDTGHANHYSADIVLNQNLHAHEGLYGNREPYTQLLLGTCYALLRREFLKWRRWRREIPGVARKLLVTLGGSDPDNVTLKIIQALQQVGADGLETAVMVGGSNPHYEELQSTVRNMRLPIRLEKNVTDMAAFMAWADVAVSAGGSSVWELAFMGVPIIGLSCAEQETKLLQGSTQCGISLTLGYCHHIEARTVGEMLIDLLHDKAQRSTMSRIGRSLVDGIGPMRVLSSMKEKE